MRILIIANTVVGIQKEKRAVVDRVVARIAKMKGIADVAYIYEHGIGRIYSARAALEGYDAVYAAGGDGTINEVATGLVNRKTPLGIIPLGTGNGLARALGIPTDPDAIIDVLMKRNVRSIDTGLIDGHTFLATAGIGFDAYIADEFNRSRRVTTSIGQYAKTGIKLYFTRKPEQVTIEVNGTTLTRKIFGLTVANTSQYGGGAVIAPTARPDSGELVAVLIPKINPFRALIMLRQLFAGTTDQSRHLEYITFTSMTIQRSAPGLVQTDGEAFEGPREVTVKVEPASLHVYLP